jgi:hypothetical protein
LYQFSADYQFVPWQPDMCEAAIHPASIQQRTVKEISEKSPKGGII